MYICVRPTTVNEISLHLASYKFPAICAITLTVLTAPLLECNLKAFAGRIFKAVGQGLLGVAKVLGSAEHPPKGEQLLFFRCCSAKLLEAPEEAGLRAAARR